MSRLETGNWEFNAAEDPDWDDPALQRLRVQESEYAQIADAVVRKQRLEIDGHEAVNSGGGVCFCILDLRRLYDEVAAHADVHLARAEEDTDGFLRQTGAFDAKGNEVQDAPTVLGLRGCVVDSCDFSDCVIGCRFVIEAQITNDAYFESTKFADRVGFKRSRFINDAYFEYAQFARGASFGQVCFAKSSQFEFARFTWYTDFRSAHFVGDTSFRSAGFAQRVEFTAARFGENVDFSTARFGKYALFEAVHFAGPSKFIYTIFEREAVFSKSRWDSHGEARSVRFCDRTWFNGVRIARTGRLKLITCQFGRNVNFDDATIRGGLFFTGSTLDERLTFDDATFGSGARLGLRRFLMRGGATIELRRAQLFDKDRARRVSMSRVGLGGTRRRSIAWRVWEAVRPARRWFGQCRPPAFIEGDDARDAESMNRAADDYELLAANFKIQPATDWEEDWCRWRAHELRRRAEWVKLRERLKDFFTSSDTTFPSLDRLPMQARWGAEYVVLMATILVSYARFAARACWEIVARWLVERTLIGHLIQIHRIVISGAFVISVCTLMYAVWASDTTIIANPIAAEGPRPWDEGVWERLRFGVYFSLTTFVTLGYGDFAPASWFKLLTGLEALCGVTLLALFTVAWGRKLVR